MSQKLPDSTINVRFTMESEDLNELREFYMRLESWLMEQEGDAIHMRRMGHDYSTNRMYEVTTNDPLGKKD